MDLDGVRVLDLSLLLPGPFATQLLADLGADVVSIEPPGGDPARQLPSVDPSGAIFGNVNQGKRSATLDLKSDAGRRAFEALATEADVVVEGFRPETARRLGVDYDSVSAYNPDVVHCSITGFGLTGPLSDRPAHGLTVTGLAGFLDQNRSAPDAEPTVPEFSVTDQSTGLVAALSILGGLLSRELGGGGCHVDAAMLESVLSLSGNVAPRALAGQEITPGAGPFTGQFPWYDLYECADGGYVTLAALEEPFWESFCSAIDRPDLVDRHGSTDPAVLEALRAELTALFEQRTRDEWIAELPESSMVGPVRSLAEALDGRHVRERNLVDRRGDPRIGFPALVDGTRPTASGVPAPGEHTAEVLLEAGADDALVDRVTGD
jgi:crotonobetainyl-CoA:carnitine CoA-transferase CaiB-like acyl-CoA transferase